MLCIKTPISFNLIWPTYFTTYFKRNVHTFTWPRESSMISNCHRLCKVSHSFNGLNPDDMLLVFSQHVALSSRHNSHVIKTWSSSSTTRRIWSAIISNCQRLCRCITLVQLIKTWNYIPYYLKTCHSFIAIQSTCYKSIFILNSVYLP